jgi:predicted dehydrogenase
MPEGKKIRVALAGCGGMARGHARALLAEPEVDVVAICDTAESHSAAYQKDIFAPAELEPAVFASYERMLGAVELDAVVLATPHTLHYEQIMAGLDGGLHVLVEKPMVTDSVHAGEVVGRTQAAGKVVAIAFQGPCSVEFAYIRDALRAGSIGQVQLVDTFVAQDWMRGTAGTWRQDPKLSGGGELYDSGAHMLTAMLWFVEQVPVEVFAVMDNCGTAVDINSVLTVRFGDGCLGSVACAGNSVGFGHRISLYGTEGTLRAGVHGDGLEHIDRGGRVVKYPSVPYKPESPVSNFVSAIMGRDEVRCGPRDGLRLALLMDAVYESSRRGRPVSIRQLAEDS